MVVAYPQYILTVQLKKNVQPREQQWRLSCADQLWLCHFTSRTVYRYINRWWRETKIGKVIYILCSMYNLYRSHTLSALPKSGIQRTSKNEFNRYGWTLSRLKRNGALFNSDWTYNKTSLLTVGQHFIFYDDLVYNIKPSWG